MEGQANDIEAKYSTSTELTLEAYAFESKANLQLVSRYVGRLHRAYDRAIHDVAQNRSGSGQSGSTEDSNSQNEK
jgi:hypothetical protein